MSIHRYEATDKKWGIIEPLIPKRHMGRPQKDVRGHFDGILIAGAQGVRWEDIPERYGPRQIVHSCVCRWRDDGTLERLFHSINADAELSELSISHAAGRGIYNSPIEKPA